MYHVTVKDLIAKYEDNKASYEKILEIIEDAIKRNYEPIEFWENQKKSIEGEIKRLEAGLQHLRKLIK